MLQGLRKFGILVAKTFVGTIFCGGVFHLVLITAKAITSGQWGYVNPIDFLGLGYAFSSLMRSTTATIVAWVVLIALYFVIMYVIAHYKRYIGIVQQTNSYRKLTNLGKKSSTTPTAAQVVDSAKSSRESQDT
ncbi:MAG: hypothetical protein WC498_02150 [Candidatus Saccharimonadales bacterium]